MRCQVIPATFYAPAIILLRRGALSANVLFASVLAALNLSGCGTSGYDALMDQRLTELKFAAPFSVLYAPPYWTTRG